MTFGSICSGIEAASVAWHPLGWRTAFVSEIEPFPCSVLKHHWPDVPNHGDITQHGLWPKEFQYEAISGHHSGQLDVIIGGRPVGLNLPNIGAPGFTIPLIGIDKMKEA